MMKTLDDYMKMPYRMEMVEDQDEGGYVISYPDLPGCITCGETIESAVANAADAKRAWIEAAIEEGIGEASEKQWNTDLNDTQQKIIKLLLEDNQLSAVKLAEKIGVASRNIENNIKKLKKRGILVRHGSPKNGYWEIIN